MEINLNDYRWIIKNQNDNFTDNELLEAIEKFNLIYYMGEDSSIEYEYIGNFILTKDKDFFNNCVDNMCCGIHTFDNILSNNEKIYFAFDYGH